MDHPHSGHSGYIMPANAYVLVSLQAYVEQEDGGEYFVSPQGAGTNTVQKIVERKWDVTKGKRDIFRNMQTVLT